MPRSTKEDSLSHTARSSQLRVVSRPAAFRVRFRAANVCDGWQAGGAGVTSRHGAIIQIRRVARLLRRRSRSGRDHCAPGGDANFRRRERRHMGDVARCREGCRDGFLAARGRRSTAGRPRWPDHGLVRPAYHRPRHLARTRGASPRTDILQAFPRFLQRRGFRSVPKPLRHWEIADWSWAWTFTPPLNPIECPQGVVSGRRGEQA